MDEQGQPVEHHGVVAWGPRNRLWTVKGGARRTSIQGIVLGGLESPHCQLPEVGVGVGPEGVCLECEKLMSCCSKAKSRQSLALLETVLRCDRQSAESSVLAEALLPYVVESLQEEPYLLISALILMFTNPSTTTKRPRNSKPISPPVNCSPITGVDGECFCQEAEGPLGGGGAGADWFPGISVGFYPSSGPSSGKGMPPLNIGIPKNASSQSLRYGRGGGATTAGPYSGPGFLYMCKRPVSLRKIHSDLCLAGATPGSPWLRIPRSTATASTDMRITSSTSSVSEMNTSLPLMSDHREDGFGPDWSDIGASASFCNDWSHIQTRGGGRAIDISAPNSPQTYPGCCSPSISNESISPPSLLAYDRPSSPVMGVPQRCQCAEGSFGSVILPILDVIKVTHIAKTMEMEADRSERFNDAAMLRCFLYALDSSRGRPNMNDFIIVAGEPTARRGLGLSSTLLMRVADSDGNYHTTGGSWPDLTAEIPSGDLLPSRSLPTDPIEDEASLTEDSLVEIRPTLCCCAVCHEDVKGLATVCNVCEHGGHVAHISSWFDRPGKSCPVLNCRCKCAF